MSGKIDLQQEIFRLTGRTIEANQWTVAELGELRARAETRLPPGRDLVEIPLKPLGSCPIDPRIELPAYQKLLCFGPNKEERLRAFSIDHKQLLVILSLEGTLIDLIPSPQNQSLLQILSSQQLNSNSDKVTTITAAKDKSFVLAVRKHANEFLAEIKTVAKLFLISKYDYQVVRTSLETLQWVDLFEDVIAEVATRSVDSCFPRLTDPTSRSLLLIFDDRVDLWDSKDRSYILPSKRYLALQRLLDKQQGLNFFIDDGIAHTETLQEDRFSLYEADPNSNQLLHISRRMNSLAVELFTRQYDREAKTLFPGSKSTQGEKAYIAIPNLLLSREVTALLRISGRKLVDDQNKSDVVIIEQQPTDVRAKRVEVYAEVVQRFFRIDARSN